VKKAMNVSQCENDSDGKPSKVELVSDRLCSRLNVNGSDVCEVNADLMVGVGTSWL
jgi:hypothetical protein